MENRIEEDWKSMRGTTGKTREGRKEEGDKIRSGKVQYP